LTEKPRVLVRRLTRMQLPEARGDDRFKSQRLPHKHQGHSAKYVARDRSDAPPGIGARASSRFQHTPRTKLSHQAFLTRARVAAANGSSHRDLLIRYGMPETFLDELRAVLDQFEHALNEKHNGRAAQVGARAELEAVTSEIMLIVRQLDALNRFRFRKDAESLAAWKSARDVAWPAAVSAGEGEKSAA
jgi:hypothetical protein